MKWIAMLLLLLACVSCGTIEDGFKYEDKKLFVKNMNSEHAGYARDYLKSESGQDAIEFGITKYIKERINLFVYAIITTSALLTALVALFGWARSHVKWKKSNGNGKKGA